MQTNRTNRTWTNVGPSVYISNDGVRIKRRSLEEGYGWVSTFPEEDAPIGWNTTLASAILDADALEYDVVDGLWVVK